MEIYVSTCKDYDPIIGEYEYLKNENLCTEEAVWRLIERIIDTQIEFTLNLKNLDAVKIINIHSFNENMRTSTKLAQLTKVKLRIRWRICFGMYSNRKNAFIR